MTRAAVSIVVVLVPLAGNLILLLRVSAFRIDGVRVFRYFGIPAFGPSALRPDLYDEDGQRLLRWLWVGLIVQFVAIGISLYLT